jgi:Flp pilus assembly protein TadG
MRRTFSSVSGAAIIETALVIPLLLLMTFAIAEFAMMFYAYLALENGVSQATRYAITGNQMEDPDNPGEQLDREESIMIAMRNATPTLTLDEGAFTFSHLPEGADEWLSGVGGPDDIAKVSINYTWTFITPLVRPFFNNGELNLTVESAMKSEGRFE